MHCLSQCILAQPKSSVPTYEIMQAQGDTLTHGAVNMKDNPAYQTTLERGGTGTEVKYYSRTSTGQNVKITENPSYAVP